MNCKRLNEPYSTTTATFPLFSLISITWDRESKWVSDLVWMTSTTIVCGVEENVKCMYPPQFSGCRLLLWEKWGNSTYWNISNSPYSSVAAVGQRCRKWINIPDSSFLVGFCLSQTKSLSWWCWWECRYSSSKANLPHLYSPLRFFSQRHKLYEISVERKCQKWLLHVFPFTKQCQKSKIYKI